MALGRPHAAPLVLREEDRPELLRWSKRTKSSNGLAQRARIVLRCAEGEPSSHVASQLGVRRTQVLQNSCFPHLSSAGKQKNRKTL